MRRSPTSAAQWFKLKCLQITALNRVVYIILLAYNRWPITQLIVKTFTDWVRCIENPTIRIRFHDQSKQESSKSKQVRLKRELKKKKKRVVS